MIRIETSVRRDRVIFAVIGRIEASDLPELKRLIESHKPPVILDLKGVTLVHREVVTFLANFETGPAGSPVGSQVKANEAQMRQALAAYQRTILSAFQDLENGGVAVGAGLRDAALSGRAGQLS